MTLEKSIDVIAVELQESITDKLRVILGEEGVEILTEYVWHMLVSSKRNRQHIMQELQEFLAEETADFVDWVLTVIVPKIDAYVHQEPSSLSRERSYTDRASTKELASPPHEMSIDSRVPQQPYASSSPLMHTMGPADTASRDPPDPLQPTREPPHSSIKRSPVTQKDDVQPTSNVSRSQHGQGSRVSACQPRRGRILGLAMQQAVNSNLNQSYTPRGGGTHNADPEIENDKDVVSCMHGSFVASDTALPRYRPTSVHSLSGSSVDPNAAKHFRRRSPFQPTRLYDLAMMHQETGPRAFHRGASSTHRNYRRHQSMAVNETNVDYRGSPRGDAFCNNLRRHPYIPSREGYKPNDLGPPRNYDMEVPPTKSGAAEALCTPHDTSIQGFAYRKGFPPLGNDPRMDSNFTPFYAPPLNSLLDLQQAAAAQGYTLAPQGACALAPGAAIPPTKKLKKRCTKWPDCPFGDHCRFIHPAEMCNQWPYCPFGSSCFYIHPEVPCKFGMNCHNCNCNYSHPEKWDPTKNVYSPFNTVFFQNKTLNLASTSQRPTNTDATNVTIAAPQTAPQPTSASVFSDPPLNSTTGELDTTTDVEMKP